MNQALPTSPLRPCAPRSGSFNKVRQPTQTSVQTDVTDKVQAKFRKRLVTPLGRYAELFGAGTPGAQNTLKVKLKDPRDGKVKYLEFPQDAALDLTEKPIP